MSSEAATVKTPVTSVEDQVTDSDSASSAAASAKVDVHVDGDSDGQAFTRHFDSAVSDNLIAMLITQAQHDLAMNMATSRNLLASSAAALTLGVQQTHAAATVQMFKMSPLEAQALGLLTTGQPPQSA